MTSRYLWIQYRWYRRVEVMRCPRWWWIVYQENNDHGFNDKNSFKWVKIEVSLQASVIRSFIRSFHIQLLIFFHHKSIKNVIGQDFPSKLFFGHGVTNLAIDQGFPCLPSKKPHRFRGKINWLRSNIHTTRCRIMLQRVKRCYKTEAFGVVYTRFLQLPQLNTR